MSFPSPDLHTAGRFLWEAVLPELKLYVETGDIGLGASMATLKGVPRTNLAAVLSTAFALHSLLGHVKGTKHLSLQEDARGSRRHKRVG